MPHVRIPLLSIIMPMLRWGILKDFRYNFRRLIKFRYSASNRNVNRLLQYVSNMKQEHSIPRHRFSSGFCRSVKCIPAIKVAATDADTLFEETIFLIPFLYGGEGGLLGQSSPPPLWFRAPLPSGKPAANPFLPAAISFGTAFLSLVENKREHATPRRLPFCCQPTNKRLLNNSGEDLSSLVFQTPFELGVLRVSRFVQQVLQE